MFRLIFHKIEKEMAFRVSKKKAIFPTNRKVVSFTFDDFPESAFLNGARILDKYDIKGTFYASMGFSDTKSNEEIFFTKQHIKEISNHGHEVGCHTFDHINCFRSNPESIRSNCFKNQMIIKHLSGIAPTSFAYPYGDFNSSSKRIIDEMYKCARTVKPGLNNSKIDLNCLKSVPIFERTGERVIYKWLNKLSEKGGWLIFYTHDIKDNHSPFGCTLELFQKIVKECYHRQYSIVPIKDALKLIFV